MLKDPRRFRIPENSKLLTYLRLNIKEGVGVFFPDFGTYLVISEERGLDTLKIEDFTGMPEDEEVEWID
jgi:hypothetical protein